MSTTTGLNTYVPNGRKICQHSPFQGPPKFFQNGILGLEIYHLATLVLTGVATCFSVDFEGFFKFLTRIESDGQGIYIYIIKATLRKL
jgi:hypothetical protein